MNYLGPSRARASVSVGVLSMAEIQPVTVDEIPKGVNGDTPPGSDWAGPHPRCHHGPVCTLCWCKWETREPALRGLPETTAFQTAQKRSDWTSATAATHSLFVPAGFSPRLQPSCVFSA